MTRLLPALTPILQVSVLLAFLHAVPGRATEAVAGDVETRAPVDQLYAALLDVMQRSDQLTYQERYAHLDPVIRQVYDMPFMSGKVLGRYWKQLSEPDRERWVSAFTRMVVSTYTDRFDEDSGQRFEVMTVEPSIMETRIVRTRIHPADEEPIELDYRLHSVDGSWRIVDVFMNGTVSELALRRSEYSSVFKREGFESLLSSLEEKVASP